MEDNKKASQVAGTTSEEKSKKYTNSLKLQNGDHKLCNFCKEVICITDNYCGYCGKANPKLIS